MLNIARLAFAASAIVAMTYLFASLNTQPGYAKANFFSCFTIQSNVPVPVRRRLGARLRGVLGRAIGLAAGFAAIGAGLLWASNRRALR